MISAIAVSLYSFQIFSFQSYLWVRELLATREKDDINVMETAILVTFF